MTPLRKVALPALAPQPFHQSFCYLHHMCAQVRAAIWCGWHWPGCCMTRVGMQRVLKIGGQNVLGILIRATVIFVLPLSHFSYAYAQYQATTLRPPMLHQQFTWWEQGRKLKIRCLGRSVIFYFFHLHAAESISIHNHNNHMHVQAARHHSMQCKSVDCKLRWKAEAVCKSTYVTKWGFSNLAQEQNKSWSC